MSKDGKLEPFVIEKPESDLLKELADFCKKWGALKEGARIRSCEVKAAVDNICLIKVELIAVRPKDLSKSKEEA